MSEAIASEAGPGTAPEFRLAECWADFTKAIAIYPDSNERVRAKLREMLALLAAALQEAKAERSLDPERGISILFREDVVVLPSESHDLPPSSALAWLRTRLDHAGLAGVELLPEVTEESVIGFSRQLLANYLRKEPGVSARDLWPEVHEGVVLIDRRFDGTFGGVGGTGTFAGGSGMATAGTDTRHFINSLLAHPKVSKRLARIQAHTLDQIAEGETTGRASDMLKTIVDELPADAMHSRDALISAVCDVMEGIEGRVGGAAANHPASADNERFINLMHQVSRQHFARQGPELERLKTAGVVQTPAGGRARDADIDDDVEQLLEEVNRLPATLGVRLADDAADAAAEQLTVLMHYLVNLERPSELRGLYPLLNRVLESPGPGEFAVLRRYLEGEAESEAVRMHRRAAVIEFLVRAGQPYLLRACGALTPEYVLESFPKGFGLYLETIDMDSPRDAEELDDVCRKIGDERLLEAGPALQGDLAKLTSRQSSALFNRPNRDRLALISLLLAHHPESRVIEAATFLRALDLPEEENFLLFHFNEFSLMTEAYLRGLIDLHFKRCTREDLYGAVSEVLCRHILAMRQRNPQDRARLDSIRHLARFPSARGWHLLQEIAKAGFGPFGGKEPASVRRLARTVSRDYKAA